LILRATPSLYIHIHTHTHTHRHRDEFIWYYGTEGVWQVHIQYPGAGIDGGTDTCIHTHTHGGGGGEGGEGEEKEDRGYSMV
jgi:hypothetical protein